MQKLFKNWFTSKKKVLSFGQLGFFYDHKGESYSKKNINDVLKLVDIEFLDQYYLSPLGLKVIAHVDRKDIEYERDYKFEVPVAKIFKSLNDKNKVWASIEDTINNRSSPVIIHNDQFFMVHAGFDIFMHPQRFFSQWRVNPYKVAQWLIDDLEAPFPDTTTLNGKRIYYGHIDGDAYINVSDYDRQNISGVVLVDQVLNKYRLPTTISYVIAELDTNYLGKPRFLEAAKQLAKLDYIELASHTYFHPFSWEVKPTQYEIDVYLDDPSKYKGGPILAYKPKDNKLDYVREIKGSIDYINEKIAPKGKETNFLLWSGSCLPPEAALEVVNRFGYLNMNGGDSRFDRSYPSLSHLQPLYRTVGKYIQYYSSNSNEIPYTSNWTGPFSGYEKVIETFENSEKPVRMKPVNIYYHFYSGEKLSSLAALKKIYDWTIAQDIHALYASEYPPILQGFIETNIKKIADKKYELKNVDKIKTFRFDITNQHIDYKNSDNVIGHRVINDSLYVSLGPKSSATIALTSNEPTGIYLSSSHYSFSKFQVSPTEVTLAGKSNWGGEIVLFTNGKKLKENESYASVKYEGKFAHIKMNSLNIETTIELSE